MLSIYTASLARSGLVLWPTNADQLLVNLALATQTFATGLFLFTIHSLQEPA